MTTDSVYSTQQAASKTGMTPSRASTGGTESTRPEEPMPARPGCTAVVAKSAQPDSLEGQAMHHLQPQAPHPVSLGLGEVDAHQGDDDGHEAQDAEPGQIEGLEGKDARNAEEQEAGAPGSKQAQD